MQITVLNGVNLDQLARRDPKLYGGLSLNELESQIYAWAHALDITARCRQTNSEGEYVEWIHMAYEEADGVIVNPGAWSHYSWAIHDALDVLRLVGGIEQRLRARHQLARRGVEDDAADLLAHRRVAGLEGEHHLAALRLQPIDEQPGLGGLARALATLEAHEQPGPRILPRPVRHGDHPTVPRRRPIHPANVTGDAGRRPRRGWWRAGHQDR